MRVETRLKPISICAAIVLSYSGYAMADTWTTLDAPGASYTCVKYISGSILAGEYYTASNNSHGFLYNSATKNWTTLDMPGANRTTINGISGNDIVGTYADRNDYLHGFLYNGTTWATLDAPEATLGSGTGISAIDGSNLVGCFGNASGPLGWGWHGFLYNGTTWTTVDAPGAYETAIFGISGNNLVGWYNDASYQDHGFIYDGTSWITIDKPGATSTLGVYGISGSNLVGSYMDTSGNSHGFLYDGTTWSTLDYSGATWTQIYGISGNNLFGDYSDVSGIHGFIYTIPEPATLLLLGFGAVMVARKR